MSRVKLFMELLLWWVKISQTQKSKKCDPPKRKLFKQNDVITPYNLKLKLFGVLAASNIIVSVKSLLTKTITCLQDAKQLLLMGLKFEICTANSQQDSKYYSLIGLYDFLTVSMQTLALRLLRPICEVSGGISKVELPAK